MPENGASTVDEEFRLIGRTRAVDELLRVTRGEVRPFPLSSLDRERFAVVDPAVDRLREQGVEAEVRPVGYEFQPGATEMLVLS